MFAQQAVFRCLLHGVSASPNYSRFLVSHHTANSKYQMMPGLCNDFARWFAQIIVVTEHIFFKVSAKIWSCRDQSCSRLPSRAKNTVISFPMLYLCGFLKSLQKILPA